MGFCFPPSNVCNITHVIRELTTWRILELSPLRLTVPRCPTEIVPQHWNWWCKGFPMCNYTGFLVSKVACLPVIFCTVRFSTEVFESVTLPYAVQSTRTAWNLQGVSLRPSVSVLTSLDPVWFNIKLNGDWHDSLTLLQGLNTTRYKNIFSFY